MSAEKAQDPNLSQDQTQEAPPTSGVIEVSAKKEGFDEVTITYDFGKDLNEMTAKFGADTVFSNARANMKVGLQGVMRSLLVAGKDQAAIQEECNSWKPGVQRERTVDPLAVARKHMAGMTEEEKRDFIEKILSGEN